MKFSGLILAGGLSSRYGSIKALAELNGKTLVRQWVDTLTLAGCSAIGIVVNKENSEVIRAAVGDTSVQILWVYQDDPESAQFSSIQKGIEGLTDSKLLDDGTLLTPVDVLPPDQETMHRLVDKVRSTLLEDPVIASQPMFVRTQHRGHPVFLKVSFCRELLTLDPDVSRLDEILRQNRPRVLDIPVTDMNVVTNINTPLDGLSAQ
ncbi:MAG: NTP transferase domain-containing protein [Oligoflexia bacterium]|nr:NTP transferase domain-containing protein [Oligoflexia bacterium]